MKATRLVPVALLLVGVLIGVLRLAGPADDLYPVEGDSAKYNAIAQGFKQLYSHPLDSFSLWISRSAGQEELKRFGFDSWVLQHAPAYTALLGIFYLLPGNDVAAGRFCTVLLFALGALILYLLGRELFGFGPGLAAALLFLFWPAHWYYGPAILTELPMAAAGLAAAYAIVRTGRGGSTKGWILGGVMIGVLVLTKTPLRVLAIPWILLEGVMDRAPDRKQVVRRAGYRLAGWGATQVLWVIFLWGFHLSPNPLSAGGEEWLWIYRGDYVPDRGWEKVGVGDTVTPELMEAARRVESLPESGRKGELYKQAFFATVRNHPGGMVALITSKMGIYWGFPAVKTFVRAGPVELPPPVRLQPALAVLGLLGLALCIGRGSGRTLPAAVPLLLTMLYSVTHMVSRYNIPAVPFAMLYGMGAVWQMVGGLRGAVRKARADLPAFLTAGTPWLRPASICAGGILAGFLMMRAGGSTALLGPILVGGGSLPLAARLLGRGRIGLVRGTAFLLPLVVLSSGAIANNTDRDQRRVTLRRPGDGVRLRVALPQGVGAPGFTAAEVQLDLLPSVQGSVTLSVRLNGSEIALFEGRPPSGPDAFLLDRTVNAENDRYKRVLRSVDRHLNGFVRRHRGLEDAGYDYYRQWYRVPVPPEAAFASLEAILEVRLIEARGGGAVDLFLDRDAPAAPAPGHEERVIAMPAFFENPYELSSYRFDALCSRRLLADSRLVRPVKVRSVRQAAERFDERGRVWALRGEPRIRLRGKLPGGWGLVRDAEGELEPAFVSDPSRAVRMLAPQELRVVMADRDRYTSGWVAF